MSNEEIAKGLKEIEEEMESNCDADWNEKYANAEKQLVAPAELIEI